ncbi:Coiled-coil domain-containing protein 39 [Globomyces sp. JEL0801]|nr:Coiled-coil domain-containing protein 39 [Globomyces sp. JEL0801]
MLADRTDRIVKKKDDDNSYVHSLPPFANVTNKALSERIKQLTDSFNHLQAVVEDNKARADSIAAHMKNVHSETTHTQALYDAKNRQIQTEEHFKQLSEREDGRLKLEMKRMGNEVSAISDQLNILQTSIYKGNEKLEVVKAEFKLETDELNEWLRVQAEKEEDNLALVKYSKEDDSKTKELSLAIEKLMMQVTETQVCQIELENTAEAFKQLHQERQDLIKQWEQAVEGMKQRDDDINKSQASYREQKDLIRKTQERIKEKQELYQSQLNLNEETEKNITMAERKVMKFRYHYDFVTQYNREEETNAIKGFQLYRDDVEVLKHTLNKSANDLINRRMELNNLKDDLKERREKYELHLENHSKLKKKLVELDDETVSLEARAEQNLSKVRRYSKPDKKKRIYRLRLLAGKMIVFKQFREAAIRNLKSKIHKLDQDTLKQRAMLYSMEYGVQQLERKIRRLEGDRTDEEKNELLSKITALTKKLDEETLRWSVLNNQLKRSQEDLRHSRRHYEALEKTKEEINTAIGELNVYNESAAHQLNTKIKEKENMMVEENILRLELRRLRSFVHARSDEVFTLETKQVQLSLALEERTKEIDIHKDMLKVQIKNAEVERHSAATELRDRIGKVEKLKKRYEILMTQFAPEDGEEDHSQAFYVIKAAQKREELQREGDELDANIRKAEKEIKALENTLKLMNNRNEQFRMNLYQAELDSKDIQHKDMLDSEYRQTMEAFKKKRTTIQDLQQSLQDFEREFSSQSTKEAHKLQQLQVLEAKSKAVQNEIDEQLKKKHRAWNFVRKYCKAHRKGLAHPTFDEQDLLIRSFREIGTIALTDLMRLTERFPEITESVSLMMEVNGLQSPSRTVSRVSSRASSIADSSPASSRANSRAPSVANSRSNSRANSRASLAPEESVQSQAPKVLPPWQQQSVSSPLPSLPKASIPTKDFNASISLPEAPLSRSHSTGSVRSSTGSNKGQEAGASANAVKTPSRGPITGAERIKKLSRPGSASSLSSHGSKSSMK